MFPSPAHAALTAFVISAPGGLHEPPRRTARRGRTRPRDHRILCGLRCVMVQAGGTMFWYEQAATGVLASKVPSSGALSASRPFRDRCTLTCAFSTPLSAAFPPLGRARRREPCISALGGLPASHTKHVEGQPSRPRDSGIPVSVPSSSQTNALVVVLVITRSQCPLQPLRLP